MVVSACEDRDVRLVADGDVHSLGSSAKSDRQGRLLVSSTAALITAAVAVGWMFGGFSGVRLVLPDDAVAPARVATAQQQVPPIPQQLRAWLAELESPLDALLTQRDDIATAAANADMAGMQRACEAGQAVLPQLHTLLPSPDPTLTAALQQTLDDFGFGFSECLTGLRNQDAADIEMASVYLYRANNDLRTVMALIARALNDADSGNLDVVTI